MKRKHLWIALGLLLVVNAVVLGGVAYNRSGEPDAVLALTERELPLAWAFDRSENTGVFLALNVHYDRESLLWLDAAKLAQLGFDTEAANQMQNRRAYRALPREAFVVLEYEGPAWNQYRQRRLEEIAELAVKVEQGKLEADAAERQTREKQFALGVASRLFCIDAGTDPKQLRQRYADRGRYLILPGRVRMAMEWVRDATTGRSERQLRGRLDSVLVQRLHVPLKMMRDLPVVSGRSRIQPGYTYYNSKNPAQVTYLVQLAAGRRFEPWIRGIEAYPAE